MVIFQTRIWHSKTNLFFSWNKKTVELLPGIVICSLWDPAGNKLRKNKHNSVFACSSRFLLAEALPVFACYLGVIAKMSFSSAFRLPSLSQWPVFELPEKMYCVWSISLALQVQRDWKSFLWIAKKYPTIVTKQGNECQHTVSLDVFRSVSQGIYFIVSLPVPANLGNAITDWLLYADVWSVSGWDSGRSAFFSSIFLS